MQPLPDERELIRRAQKGDKEAISALYRAYAQPIFRYISYRVDSTEVAEDLTADIFLRMVRNLPNYKLTAAPFGAWLFRIAANRITDFYREIQPSEALSEEYSIEPYDDTFEQEDERSRLRAALRKLPEEYQTILILRFMQELPHADVASIIGKSTAAVRVVQHRALKSLAALLRGGES